MADGASLAAGVSLSNIAVLNIYGRATDDLLTGDRRINVLRGLSGSDRIYGLTGSDSLYGGDGDDLSIFGGGNADNLFGGTGDDSLIYGAGGTDSISGGLGNDVGLFGANLEDVIDGGSSNDSFLDGGGGQDTVWGRSGDDLELIGSSGADSVYGGAGDDLILVRSQGELVPTNLTLFSDKFLGGGDQDTLLLKDTAYLMTGIDIGGFVAGHKFLEISDISLLKSGRFWRENSRPEAPDFGSAGRR